MKQEIDQGLHEKLCAFVLGEADEATRAEVAQALEASAELRAERERLEGTIGLVKGAFAGGEALSSSATARILSAAGAPRRRPWHMRPAWRMAAGFAAVALGGYVVARVMEARPEDAGPFGYWIFGDEASSRGDCVVEKGAAPAAEADVKDERAGLVAQANVPAPANEPAHVDAAPAPISPVAGAGVGGEADGTYAGPGDTVAGTPLFVEGQTPPVTVEVLERLDELRKSSEAQIDLGMIVPKVENEAELLYRSSQAGFEVAQGATTPTPPAAGGGGAVAGRILRAEVKVAPPSRPTTGIGRSGPSSPRSHPTEPTGGLSAPAEKERGRVAHGEEPAERNKLLAGLGYIGEDREAGSDDFFLGKRVSIAEQLRALSPADRDRYVDLQCQRILTGCRRLPSERPRDMFFRFYGDNAFEIAALDRLSTFSIDVDTASYALARRYLNEGHLPEKAQIRTEEFVNYFDADVAAPRKGVFAIHTDLAPSRFGGGDANRWMLRVVVRGREVQKEERKPLHVTFVVDTSGSMREQGRLELVKHAMRLLVNELDARDAIAIVAFSSEARRILPMTSARQKAVIESAIHPLQPEGSTNAAAGMTMGYEIALAGLDVEANNRVVLLSDGVANTGETDQDRITENVRRCRERGISLNTIGVGMGNHNDALLERLADKGDGVCNYVDTADEARRAIVDRFTGAFETIARDVKIQVEFDPTQVHRYRLLGYENRAIADQDFRNDKVDAGEVGAGHQVTALYEIERLPNASEKPLAAVRLRWKAPRNPAAPQADEEASEAEVPVSVARQTSFEGAGAGYRRAVIVAQFAEILRRSVHARGESLDDAIAEADKLRREIRDPEFDELVVLMHKCRQLVLDSVPACDEMCQAIETVRRNQILRCEHELLAKNDPKWIEDLERQNAELERRIRDLVRQSVEARAR